ncbi:MAG: FAD-dependent monooxygenase [Egibacteraceae bacterium]
MSDALKVPILIVGGGPVGLSTSILLSRFGIGSLLVEKHPGTAPFPKSLHISTRTMELFRQWGIAEAVEAAGLPREQTYAMYVGETLTSKDFQRSPIWLANDHSPTSPYACHQDALESVLQAHAARLGPGRVRFGTQLVDLAHDEQGVTAELVERDSGSALRVRAAYLVGADGARSTVRSALGIELVGRAALAHWINIFFEADLRPHLAGRLSALSYVQNREMSGLFVISDTARRWRLLTPYRPEHGESARDFTEARCAQLVRAGVGRTDLEVRIMQVRLWEPGAQVATRFQDGRVLLVGDAAHLCPPWGGFGMNCGIQDTHNLSWKLAAVLDGWAGEELLDTYDAERRPIARWTIEESVRNMQYELRTAASEQDRRAQAARRQSDGLVLGFAYDSTAIVPDGSAPPQVENPYTDYVPTARPGHLAPHVWLERAGVAVSTIDLLGDGFVLLTGPNGAVWRHAAARVRSALGLPLTSHVVGGSEGSLGDPSAGWPARYGLADDGAVLVRPDGHVAWRSRTLTADPQAQLLHALRHVCALDEGCDSAAGWTPSPPRLRPERPA